MNRGSFECLVSTSPTLDQRNHLEQKLQMFPLLQVEPLNRSIDTISQPIGEDVTDKPLILRNPCCTSCIWMTTRRFPDERLVWGKALGQGGIQIACSLPQQRQLGVQISLVYCPTPAPLRPAASWSTFFGRSISSNVGMWHGSVSSVAKYGRRRGNFAIDKSQPQRSERTEVDAEPWIHKII